MEKCLHAVLFSKIQNTRVITLINEVDTEAKSLCRYISFGVFRLLFRKRTPFYVDFPEYKKQSLEPNQILPDLVSTFCYGKIAPPTDRTLLSAMIYYGKRIVCKR